MERIRSINVARLHWCCADHGMTLGELAREVGISPATLDRLQAGEDGLTFRQLREIATFFGRGALFFWSRGRSTRSRRTRRSSARWPIKRRSYRRR